MRVLLLTALLACSDYRVAEPPPPVVEECVPAGRFTFFPTTTPPPDDRIAIQVSMAKWNAVTHESHLLSFSPAGHQRIAWMQPPTPTLAGQWLGDGIMFLRPDHDTPGLSLHEFGHALGLDHIQVVGAVMCGPKLRDGVVVEPFACPRVPRELHVADVEECRRVGACP